MIGERKTLIQELEASFDYYSPYGYGGYGYSYNTELQAATAKSHTLDPVFDINLKGTYSITSKFALFAQLNNLGFQGYERWFGYPVQSFNFLAGVSYAF